MVSALTDVFDTFKRPLVVYMEPEKVIVSTNPNYSRFGQRDQNVFNPEVKPVAHIIYGCVLYGNEQLENTSIPLGGGQEKSAQLKLSYNRGKVRIKVKEDGFLLLKDAKIIELDGYNFELDTTARPHGLFNAETYSFFLKRV